MSDAIFFAAARAFLHQCVKNLGAVLFKPRGFLTGPSVQKCSRKNASGLPRRLSQTSREERNV
eukprot:3824904-Amphidinium_carterae.1